jgi:hypothetical protein
MSDLKSEIEKMEKLKSLGDNKSAEAPKKKKSIAEMSAELAKAFDVWRVFPRVFITVYIVLLYQVTHWFMNLADPNNAQAGLVSVVVGAGAAWFGLYTGTGGKKNDK